jgi:hypothetical protein
LRFWSLKGESPAIRFALAAILAVFVILAVWEIDWGAPEKWHPDEKQSTAQMMLVKRTVNPGHFAYGGLPYYMLALGANLPATAYTVLFDPPRNADDPEQSAARDRHRARVIVSGRLLSVVLGAGIILITFALGRVLFDSLVGVVAAASLAVSPYFIAVCHFAIVDVAGNFWYWLAMLLSVGIYRAGGRGWYVASGFTLGLATGVKIDRVLGAIPLLVAHLFRREGLGLGRIVLLAVVGLAGYLMANLAIFTDSFTFLQGTLRDLYFNLLRGTDDTSSYAVILRDFADGMGLPLILVAGSGLLLLIASAAGGRHVPEATWLLATVLPSYLLFGSGLTTPWYAPFHFPALAIMAGFAVRWLVDRLGRPAVIAASVVMSVALAWAALQSVVFDYTLARDARYQATAWLDEHAPPGSVISTGPRAPVLDADRFQVVKRFRAPEERVTFYAWRTRLENHEPYQRLRASLTELEVRVCEVLGCEPAPEYRAWFDWEEVEPRTDLPDPDYQVLLLPLEDELRETLSAPGSGYTLAASFDPVSLMGQTASFPFVNPAVQVFQRSGSAP